jgi:hypothetical protein
MGRIDSVSMVSSDDTLLALPLFLSGKLVQCLLLSPPPTHPSAVDSFALVLEFLCRNSQEK